MEVTLRTLFLTATIVLMILILAAVFVESKRQPVLMESHPFVVALAYAFAPGFIIDALVSESPHHGTLLWFDYVLIVGLSWLSWTALVVGAIAVVFDIRQHKGTA